MRSFSLVFLLSGVLQWIPVSGNVALTLNPLSGATIHINRSETAQSKCEVCIGKLCQPSVALIKNTEVVFNCAQPEDIFTVEIVKQIVCSKTCNGSITSEEYPSLQNFSRTFTWNVVTQVQKALSLNFTKAGLRQIRPTESCRDKHVYTVSTGRTTLGRFCRHGSIKRMKVANEGSVSLQVPGKGQLDPTTFDISVGDHIPLLAIIKVSLPEEESSQEFLSPNYPDSFPDYDLVTWSFKVPLKYYTTVRIQNYTDPKCQRKDARLEYQLFTKTVVKKLSDPQLSEYQGSFNLSLQNCLMQPSSALSLHFNISAVKRASEVRCSVDLRKEKGLQIHIRKKKPTSACVLKLNSQIQETVTIFSPKMSYLSFYDCPEEDLLLNINQTIACQQQADCASPEFSLRVPVLEKCLLGVLQQVIWHLYVPQHGAVELMSPLGSLQQSLPGQTCNSSVLLTMTEHEQGDVTVGRFCPQGPIHKVQIRSNITVTASPVDGNDLRQITYALLKGSFMETINERYIFTVLPKKDMSVLLATPAWPAGMRPYSTVSWIVSFPSQLEAQVVFTNVSQVSCPTQHTGIKVQKQGSRDETYSWRMGEKPKDVVVEESFYLNMSNCRPSKGSFSVVSQITLLKRKNKILSIILSVVSVLLALVVAVLAVVCIINRKKKKQRASEVSVYNPNGHAFLPGLHGIPKTTEDEDVHIYHCIDDTMVYGHLLKDGTEMNQFEPAVDSYQAFTGPTDRQPLTEPEVGVYRPFTGSQSAPEVPERAPGQGGNPPSKDQLIADKEINGDNSVQNQTNTTQDLQAAPIAQSGEEDS
ncbi:CUB domain-containing protein 1a [Colossoma macropomum]|uniref:CUB domain-containing protein 1a n=1 Tax=Colossoma macropomum TaxID=42526 RepID=UPI001864FEE6|nr:CUB domain-containing protein 1a [Colossoma macropomum]